MADRKRPSAKDILDGVVQALYDGQEPLDEQLVLVPSTYDLLLHPEAYQELLPLLPRIKAQVRKRLDEELAQLNSRRVWRLPAFLGRVFGFFARLLSADRYLKGQAVHRAAVYERASDDWHLDVSITAEPDAEVDYLVVETGFGAKARAMYRGSPTVNIRRRTMRLPDGRFETVLTVPRAMPPSRETQRSVRRATGGGSGSVLARLSYEDNQGQHVYYMKKQEIAIGRRDEAAADLDIALDTLPDVSRTHARIRHDPATGQFLIKDTSQYGLTVDAGKVAPSLNAARVDLDVWHPLPPKAEIGLANVLFLHFEVL